MFVAWLWKSVSVVWNFWTVTKSNFLSFTVCWKISVSDLLNASFCAYSTATFLSWGLIFKAAATELGATIETGAETREIYSPIWGIPFAVLEGPKTETFALSAIGSALKACCDRVGPTIPTTLFLVIKVWKALIVPASSPAVSWNIILIGVPLIPPWSLKYFSAIFTPATCS